MRIALVGCTKSKNKFRCEAQKMYLKSSLFKKEVRYIKHNKYDKWFILSAKYGLLKPDDIIEPYELTLNNFNKKELIKWSKNVWSDLKKQVGQKDEIDFLCGSNYRKYLIDFFNNNSIKYNILLEGLSIGNQLKFYNDFF